MSHISNDDDLWFPERSIRAALILIHEVVAALLVYRAMRLLDVRASTARYVGTRLLFEHQAAGSMNFCAEGGFTGKTRT